MDKKRLLIFTILLLVVGSLFATNASAAITGIFKDVLEPLMGGTDFNTFYKDNATVIDFALVSIIFIGLCMMIFMRRFEAAGKLIGVAVGLILSFSFTYYFHYVAFKDKPEVTLGSFLGPIASIVVLGVIFVAVFEIIRGMGAGARLAGAIGYILIYFAANSFFPKELREDFALFFGIGALGLFLAIVIIFIDLGGMINRLRTGDGGGNGFDVNGMRNGIRGWFGGRGNNNPMPRMFDREEERDVEDAEENTEDEERRTGRDIRLEQINIELEDRVRTFDNEIRGLENDVTARLTRIENEVDNMMQLLQGRGGNYGG